VHRATPLAEWLVEEGIGEHRAVLVERGEIVAARLRWPGRLEAGLVEDAVLISRTAGSPRGTARFANGEEALVDGLPREASEGARLRLIVTRAALWEKIRRKLARARPSNQDPRPAPTLAEALGARVVSHFDGWDELWTEAMQQKVDFAGGSLAVEPTAALTAIDIDGTLPPRELALAAVPAIASTIRRLDLAGSIVIDFPTLEAKADRRALDEALAAALADWPHERTAINGFGLVQLIARRERPSLLELLNNWPYAASRLLLRRAEQVREPGALLLTAGPETKLHVSKISEAELARRTGREIRWQIDDTLAPGACFAQAVPL
jgi:ribonuclease G